MNIKQQLLESSLEDKVDGLMMLLDDAEINEYITSKQPFNSKASIHPTLITYLESCISKLFKDGAIQKTLVLNEEAITSFMQRQDFKHKLIQNEDCLRSLATNQQFIEKLIEYEFVVKFLCKKEKVIEAAASQIALSEERVRGLLNNSKIKDFISEYDGYLEKLVLQDIKRFSNLSAMKKMVGKNERWLSELIIDEKVVEYIINNKVVKDLISSSPSYVNSLSLNQNFVKSFSEVENIDKIIRNILLKDKVLLSDTLKSEPLAQRILENGSFLTILNHNNRVRTLLIDAIESSQYLMESLEKKLAQKLSGNSILFISTISRIQSFWTTFNKANKYLSVPKENEDNVFLALQKIINGSTDFQNLLGYIFSYQGEVILNGNSFKIIDWRGFWVPFQEIFLNKDYDVNFDNDEPFIIDAGANIGLATAYLKFKFPLAKVLCFEPSKKIRGILKENIKTQQLENVEILPYALSDKEGVVEFSTPLEDNLAGRVGEALEPARVSSEMVETKRLSRYLSRHCDFLKLDIEGQEEKVFKDIKGKLSSVDNVFVEYHGVEKEIPKGLSFIIKELTMANFYFLIGKAFGTDKYTKENAFSHLGKKQSQVIFATKANSKIIENQKNFIHKLCKWF